MSELGRTKKYRNRVINKKKLWEQFQEEIPQKNRQPIECIYRNSGQREYCEACSSILVITDEGFLGCTNSTCGIVYNDILSQGAEWRYYGTDDNHTGDPTRCGMPINPLLQESSLWM